LRTLKDRAVALVHAVSSWLLKGSWTVRRLGADGTGRFGRGTEGKTPGTHPFESCAVLGESPLDLA
jgi:hypothetical protein